MNLSVPEQLTYSTVRIECESANGQCSTGTGFFFLFLDDKETGRYVPVILTNKHVVKGAVKGKLILTKSNNSGGPIDTSHHVVQFGDFESLWKLHPEDDIDLCAMPIAPVLNQLSKVGESAFYMPFTFDNLPTLKQEEELLPIEDILMIGYPNGIWDSANNMPLFRKGSTATNPLYDYQGRKEFLIDIAAFPGSSGSPVLIYNNNGYTDKNGNVRIGANRLILLGVLYAGPQATVVGQVVNSPKLHESYSISSIPNNLGIVIKAEKIRELEELFKE
jgi:V8-like Glu-specific endopeptidase